jgi:CubicO group peptidase (beta-lactamase class C family)
MRLEVIVRLAQNLGQQMSSIRYLLFLGLPSLSTWPCLAVAQSDEWQPVTPNVVGLDQKMLETLVGKIRQSEFGNIHSLQWWLLTDSKAPDQSIVWGAAYGNGGQRIWLVPSANVVVVLTAGLYDDPNTRQILPRILNDYILAAIH